MCEDLRENFSKHFQDLNGQKTQKTISKTIRCERRKCWWCWLL